ncbi:4a-hydroxytetrahydrobiopterin dehydratase [Verrucomicrobiaceae bacterium 227]
MPEPLDATQFVDYLKSLPQWEIVDDELSKCFKFASYLDGLKFTARCGEIAEEMNHHPDLLVQWRKVTVTISTHSCGALTKLDFEFARRVEGD